MAEVIVTNPDRTSECWRVAMTTLCNQFLGMHRVFAGANGMSPTAVVIYITVAVANVQRLMRERAIPPEYAGTAILPRGWVVPISRNAIASASGLPRETVRRHVAKMIEQGLLIEDDRGGVTPPPGVIDTLGLEPMLEVLLTEFTRSAETLLRIGAVSIRQD